MAVSGDRVQLQSYDLTADEAQRNILDFLRRHPGQLLREWPVLNQLVGHRERQQLRKERAFYLTQLTKLVQEGKVIRYRKGLQRGKIRISEAYA